MRWFFSDHNINADKVSSIYNELYYVKHRFAFLSLLNFTEVIELSVRPHL